MNATQYQELAMKTEASQYEIKGRLWMSDSEVMIRLDNAVRGLAGDTGEIATCVQKYIEYGQDLDEINLKEEVGDCLWRLAQICKAIGVTLEDAMISNIEKLKVRYPDKYSDENAVESNRDRKAERQAVTFDPQTNLKMTNEILEESRSKQGVRDLAAANLELEQKSFTEIALDDVGRLQEKIDQEKLEQNGHGFAELPEEKVFTLRSTEIVSIRDTTQTGKEFVDEQLQGSTDSSYKECPLCHKRRLYATSTAKVCTNCSQKLKSLGIIDATATV